MFTTLRGKIYAGFAAIITINIVFGLWSIYKYSQVAESVNQTAAPNYELAANAIRLATLADEQYQLLQQMQSDARPILSAQFTDKASEFTQRLISIQNDPLPLSGQVVTDIRNSYSLFLQRARQYQAGLNRTDTGSERMLTGDLQPLVGSVRENCLQLLALSRDQIANARDDLGRQLQDTLYLVAITAIITAILGLIGGGIYARWAVRPINRLSLAVKNLSGGRLGERILITTADELGDLSFEFNRMIERLRRYETINIEQLLLEKRKVETVVHSIATPIIVVDAEMKTLLINGAAANIFRLEVGARYEGQPIDELVEDAGVRVALQRALRGEPAESSDWPDLFVLMEEGRERYFAIQALPLETTSSVSGAVAVFSDITHFKELDTMKSDFIAKVSHEFRTPLSSIMMSTDILREEIVGGVNEAQADLLRSTRDDCKRLSKLISDLLEVSRLESNARVRNLIQTRLVEFMDDVLKPHIGLAREKEIELTSRIDGAIPALWFDPEEFRWIVNNLVTNALRHTDAGGRVTIEGRSDGAMLTLNVSDTGHGIPLDSLSRIFEKFYQVGNTSISTPGSVGLGLAITRDVVESYGGRVTVTSEVHKGSCFEVRIPLERLERPVQA